MTRPPARGDGPARRSLPRGGRAFSPMGLSGAMARARSGRRVSALLIVYLLVTALMAWRLVSVQVVNAPEYRALAERQTQREIELPPQRGKLYDRSGEPLAMSLAAATVYANPRAIREGEVAPRSVADALAPLLGREAEELVEPLSRDTTFVYLGRQLPHGVGEQIKELRLPGIGILEEPTRTYPSPGLAAQVVGFTGVDNEGLAGMEQAYEHVLVGEPGRLWLERAPGGLTINGAPREVQPPRAGTDLVLSLDRQIQWAAEERLAAAVEEYGAIGGSAVVLDVATNEILAMASSPSYSPEAIGESDHYARRNRAVTDVFEPGSVSKVITAAAALEDGIVDEEETFTVADHIYVGKKRFKDSSPHPTKEMSFAEIIADSSNVGTIQIAQRVGEERLYDYLKAFGFGRATGLDFPGESIGLLPPVEGWWDTSLPTMAIGQGVSATLLQVAGVFSTVASGGTWTAPSLVRGTVDADGRLAAAPPPEERRVISEDTAATLADMLTGVVETGTGSRAAVPGYSVAGKTGTAQKPSTTSRGYEPGAYIASFAGFAPADDPALVVAVMLDEPRPVYYGGLTAAPVFSDILGFALAHRRVPPNVPEERETAAPVVAGTPVTP